jgi:hypothetical protein
MKITTTLTLSRLKKGLRTLILPFALCAGVAHAQTVLINPATDGGFEMGTGSLIDNGWTGVASGTNDNWYTGSGKTSGLFSFPSASRCAYVSGDGSNGANWAQGNSSPIATHMYRTITVPAGQTQVTLSFKYTQGGTTNTKLMVYVCPTSLTPIENQPTSNGGDVGTGWGANSGALLLFSAATPLTAGTITFTVPIPPSFLNNCSGPASFKLVFTSFRNASTGANPPPAVDEISVVSRTPVSASPAIFTINNTLSTSGTNFNNFTDAINWVNAVSNCGFNNPITFNVSSGQVFNENTPYVTASGTSSNQITFQKSGSGANPVIRPTGEFGAYWPTTTTPGSIDYGICLQGADYVTFDGIDITSNNVSATIAVEYGYIIRNHSMVRSGSSSNGANYNTIKNCTVLLDRTITTTKGIVQSATNISNAGGAFSIINSTGTNNNNKYLNLTIGNVNTGILLYGASANTPDANNIIGTTSPNIFNTIGRPGIPDDIGNTATAASGINLQFQNDASIFNNNVTNISSGAIVDGILIGTQSSGGTWNGSGGYNNLIYNNQITNIKGTSTSSTSSTITGIRIMHDNTGSLGAIGFKIFNNVISNLSSAYAGAANTARIIKGIHLPVGAPSNPVAIQYEFINNTVVINGSSSPNISSIAFESAYNGVVFKLRNNLFYNKTIAQTGVAQHYIIGVTGATTTFGLSGSISDYNDFYYLNAAGGLISNVNNIVSLATWQTTYNVDLHSISANPNLNSDNILYPLYSSPIIGLGPTLSSPYNKDIFGTIRTTPKSIVGAIEKGGDIVPPVIADTIILGINSISNMILPNLLTVNDEASIVATTAGSSPRIYYKKSTDANTFGTNNSSTNGWKWVEASNTVSPFSFTIDYSLLTSPVATHNIIQYFFVAQDTVAIPNIAAQPAIGFTGTSVGSVTQAPSNPKSYVIYNTPAAFQDAILSQASTAKTIVGAANQKIVRLALQTAAAGDSAYINSLTFNAAGANDLTNIKAAKVWYTATSDNFATTSQFGQTINYTAGTGALGNFVFNGAQIVPPNSTVYFWLSYDISGNAVLSDEVDASIVSLTYNGNPQTPSILSAIGTRAIKSAYCVPVIGTSYCISNVKFNTLNNTTSTCAAPSYTNFAPEGAATTTVQRGKTYSFSLRQAAASTSTLLFIDYNDDGVFDLNESTNISVISGSTDYISTVPVTIPCNAVISSEIRMRVRSYFTGTAPIACSANPGEVEDYTIAITDNVSAYESSTVTQTSGLVGVGSTDQVMMRLGVVSRGCNNTDLTAIYCKTAKTNNVSANINNVKLYATGTSKTFSSSNLINTISSAPSAQFVLNGFTSPLSLVGDTNYFWITYDIKVSATLTDTIDIAIDSITVNTANFIPGNNNPPEVLKVANKNTYVSSAVIHPNTNRTPKIGQLKTPVLQIRIITSTGAGPLKLTQLNLVTNAAGVDTTNFQSAKVYYTGNTNTFSSNTQFGTAYTETNPVLTQWDPYTINGDLLLNFDTNYFWVTYDIKNSASAGNLIDADLVNFTLNGALLTAGSNTSTGSLTIQTNYCTSLPAGTIGLGLSTANYATASEEISNVTFGTLNNSSACDQTGGEGSSLNTYSDYTDNTSVPNIALNTSVPFSVTGISNCNAVSASTSTLFTIYIDWNKDGDFTDAGENVYRPANAPGVLTGRTDVGNIVVPCTASIGKTRMRIIYAGGTNTTNTNPSSCGSANYQFGETEDYTINIVNNPVAYSAVRATQTSGRAGKGSTNVNVMRIAVKATGCGTTNLSAMYFKTTGTTNNANITSANLYATGTSNVFSTTTSIGTVAVAGSSINFTSLSSAIVSSSINDSTYFWLTYDISAGATAGNILDAVLDSISIAAVNYNTIAIGNPSESLTIVNKSAFVSAVAVHTDLSGVGKGALKRNVLRILVMGTPNDAPINITNLAFNVYSGNHNLANIDSARVFYTGKSSVFATTTTFGTAYGTPSAWGNFSITGNQLTSLDSNFFWLTYDVKSGAVVTDSADVEFVSVIFDGMQQNVIGQDGNPDGNIKIREQYCASSWGGSQIAGFTTTTSFTIGGLTTTSTCAAPTYTDNTGLAARTIRKGTDNPFAAIITKCGGLIGQSGFTNIYVDYNQDGDFTDASEQAISSTPAFSTTFNSSFIVPCNAMTGLTRLRVVTSVNAITSSCGVVTTQGETEDYTVNIENNPVAYNTSYASQTNGLVTQGRADQIIMNIKVKAGGCGIARTTNMYFNTAATNNPLTNITEAKLFTTGTSTVFSTNKLLGTYSSPNGAFDFTGALFSDTLTSDTANYWLTYEISPFAIGGDIVDVRVDSIMVLDLARIPVSNNPSQFKTIQAPMVVLNTDVSSPAPDRVQQGAVNFNILAIRVITSSTGAPIKATSFSFNTIGGTNDITDIINAKLYYTGSSSVFAPINQFGSTYVAGSAISGNKWLPFTVNGTQNLANDTNYFWLAFNVNATATLGNTIDAEVASVMIDAISQPLSNPIPAGNSIIRQDYCFSANSTGGKCIDTAKVGSINNITGSTGCASYTLYPKSILTTTDVYAGSTLPVYLTFTSATKVSIFIDLNKNGVFEANEETNLTPTNNVERISTSIPIPKTASLGETRMRIRTFGGQTQGGTNRACSDWNNSESEDYTITILPALPQTSYVWNQTAPADFTVASNWTPSRVAGTNTDRLVFGPSTTTLVVNNVISSTVKTIELSQATAVVFNALSTAEIIVTDSLILPDTATITGNSNIALQLGESIGFPGSLVLGTKAAGVNAPFKRWLNSSNSNALLFPFMSAKGSRSVNLNYTGTPSTFGSIKASFVPTKALGDYGFPVYEWTISANANTTTNEGYWTLEPGDGLQGGLYEGSFTMDSIKHVTNYFGLILISRPDEFNAWDLNGNSSFNFGSNTNVVVVRNSMTGYGQFAIAADSSQNPLPVSLLRFAAKANSNDAVLTWSTASEKNNKGFEIERSVDGRSFEAISFVKGAGNSASVINYNYNDANAFANNNILYYRLKQVDLNGKFTYSNIVKVSSYMQKSSSITAFPNPFTRDYTIALELQNNADVTMVMTDIQGKVVTTETLPAIKGSNNLTLSNIADLQSGVYFLKVTVEGETQILKVVKQ